MASNASSFLRRAARDDRADTGGGHLTEADQEGSLLSSAPGAASTPSLPDRRRSGALLAAAVAVVALVGAAAACAAAARRGAAAHNGGSALTSLQQDRSSLNLGITLANLPRERLSSEAKNEVETSVESALEGRFAQHCKSVEAEVLTHEADETASVIQVFMLPADGVSADDFAEYVLSEQEKDGVGVLLAEMLGALQSLQGIRTGEVIMSAMDEVPQDGELQYLARGAEADTDILPMGATTLDAGDQLSIGGKLVETVHMATVVEKAEGGLRLDVPLPVAYPPGTLVVLVGKGQTDDGEGLDHEQAMEGEDLGQPENQEAQVEQVAQEAEATAPITVAQAVVLLGLPSRQLSVEQRAALEEQVKQTYVDALGKSTSQVNASVHTVWSAERRRLRALADSVGQDTRVDVSVETSPGESANELKAAMDSRKGTLGVQIAGDAERQLGLKPRSLAAEVLPARVDDAGGEDGGGFPIELMLGLGAFNLCLFVVIVACMCTWKKPASSQQQEARQPGELVDPTASIEEPAAAGFLAPEPEERAAEEATKLEEVAAEEAAEEPAKDLYRAELVSQAFQRFDQDGDGRLNEKELGNFAHECCEFDGTDEEWGMEYKCVCEELGAADGQGLDVAQFAQLVDDSGADDDDGIPAMYCDNETLERARAGGGFYM